ncbi:hypothetical protein MED222_05745 [Vibrio sp. MED222]|nr:hypothetical protein MED222_05745 [Vibrio sp. MED222]
MSSDIGPSLIFYFLSINFIVA